MGGKVAKDKIVSECKGWERENVLYAVYLLTSYAALAVLDLCTWEGILSTH